MQSTQNSPFKKFLKFNGRAIYFLSKDGTYWVVIKPICEALNVNYNRQFQNLKADEFLNQLFAEQQMVARRSWIERTVERPSYYQSLKNLK